MEGRLALRGKPCDQHGQSQTAHNVSSLALRSFSSSVLTCPSYISTTHCLQRSTNLSKVQSYKSAIVMSPRFKLSAALRKSKVVLSCIVWVAALTFIASETHSAEFRLQSTLSSWQCQQLLSGSGSKLWFKSCGCHWAVSRLSMSAKIFKRVLRFTRSRNPPTDVIPSNWHCHITCLLCGANNVAPA